VPVLSDNFPLYLRIEIRYYKQMKDNEIEDVNGEPHGTSLDEIIDGLTNRRLDEE
jgi:hypothetical protein